MPMSPSKAESSLSPEQMEEIKEAFNVRARTVALAAAAAAAAALDHLKPNALLSLAARRELTLSPHLFSLFPNRADLRRRLVGQH